MSKRILIIFIIVSFLSIIGCTQKEMEANKLGSVNNQEVTLSEDSSPNNLETEVDNENSLKSNDSAKDDEHKISLEDIKARYDDNIVNITEYKRRYVLVESEYENFANKI